MPKYRITTEDGRTFEVDADNQQLALSALGIGASPAGDRAAQEEIARRPHSLLPQFAQDMKRKVMQGVTLGWDDELSAGERALTTIGSGKPLGERYASEKAVEDEMLRQASARTGAVGTAAEVAGGLGTGLGAARGGMTLLRAGQSLPMRVGAGMVEGAGYGGVQGAGSADNKLKGAAGGAFGGAVLGAALPAAAAGARMVGAPVMSRISAFANPGGYADNVIAQDVARSGRSVDDIISEVENAQAAGQPMTLADAMGIEGQRRLTSVTKAPGAGRAEAREFLETRQRGHADRVGNIIEDGLNVGPTARQEATRLGQEARQAAGPLYEASDAYPVQWDERLGQFLEDPITREALQRGIKIQRLEALAEGGAFNPADYTIAGYNAATSAPGVVAAGPNMRALDAIKKGLDDLLEKYRDPVTGRLVLDAEGRAIDQVRLAYIQHLDTLNPEYAAARRAWAGPAQQSEAIGRGKQMAAGGRFTDNVSEYDAMNPAQQAGARSGYADRVLSGVERNRRGRNAAEPLLSEKSQAELGAMSQFQGPRVPGAQDEIVRRLERESLMHSTRNHALGGSSTVENLADAADTGIDPAVISSLLRGDVMGAAGAFGRGAFNQVTGNTEAVRAELGRRLLGLPGSEPLAVMLPRVTKALRDKARRNDRAERAIVRGLLDMGAQGIGRMQ